MSKSLISSVELEIESEESRIDLEHSDERCDDTELKINPFTEESPAQSSLRLNIDALKIKQ